MGIKGIIYLVAVSDLEPNLNTVATAILWAIFTYSI
jgi:hypothetical protein